MHTLRIEHAVRDYGRWKAAFDSDPADRKGVGVLRYSVLRPVDQPNHVLIDLEFDSMAQAEGLLETMRAIWRTPVAAAALAGAPQARILEIVEVVHV